MPPGQAAFLLLCNPDSQRSYALCSFHLAGLHALRADVCPAHMAVFTNLHLLDVRTEHAIRYAVGMAHASTRNRFLAAYFANLRHFTLSNFTYLNER